MVLCIMMMLPVNISLMFPDKKDEAGEEEEAAETADKVFDSVLEWKVLHELARTIPIDYEEETLKAQAVILRTNILADGEKEEDIGYHPVLLYSYRNKWGTDYEENCAKLYRAVAQTKGLFLEKDRKPVHAPYFRLSNGSTRDTRECLGGDDPEYTVAECRKDLMSDGYLHKIQVDGDKFASKMGEISGNELPYDEWKESEVTYHKDSAGYVLEVNLGEAKIGGEVFREAFLLPSSDFFLTFEEEYVAIETKGIGAGFGFCQYGANEMAKEGKDFLNLLDYFFTNIAISKTE